MAREIEIEIPDQSDVIPSNILKEISMKNGFYYLYASHSPPSPPPPPWQEKSKSKFQISQMSSPQTYLKETSMTFRN
jgi:hypothetical protein